MSQNGTEIRVPLTKSARKSLEAYREKMLGLIGVELTEGQVAAMLIHFGKEVDVGRGHHDGPELALQTVPREEVRALPAVTVEPAPTKKRSRGTRARTSAPSPPASGRCACGCGETVSTGSRWSRGHHKRGARAARGRGEEDGAQLTSVWNGREPLTPGYDRGRGGGL